MTFNKIVLCAVLLGLATSADAFAADAFTAEALAAKNIEAKGGAAALAARPSSTAQRTILVQVIGIPSEF